MGWGAPLGSTEVWSAACHQDRTSSTERLPRRSDRWSAVDGAIRLPVGWPLVSLQSFIRRVMAPHAQLRGLRTACFVLRRGGHWKSGLTPAATDSGRANRAPLTRRPECRTIRAALISRSCAVPQFRAGPGADVQRHLIRFEPAAVARLGRGLPAGRLRRSACRLLALVFNLGRGDQAFSLPLRSTGA
jgi:hypothetical protein